MAIDPNKLLAEEFLEDLYYTSLHNEYILSIVCDQIKAEHLPDRSYQNLHRTIQKLFKSNQKCPAISVLQQALARYRDSASLLRGILESAQQLTTEDCSQQLEAYIRQVRFQKTYQKIGELYNKQLLEDAYHTLGEYSEWFNSFSLTNKDLVDVVGGFTENYRANKAKKADEAIRPPINSFYIDELDKRNKGQNLRGQMTCFLASTGVGKSHIARWIGKNACQFGGHNVLHIQLEGSRDEVVDAYSASFIGCSAFNFSNAVITDEELDSVVEELDSVSGRLYVKAYSRFGANVTTSDIYKAIQDYKKAAGVSPDIVIIDSMDLLSLPQSSRYAGKEQRQALIEITRILKDMASIENVWMVVTYQSTIEDNDKLNDEKFVLSQYNIAEAKGISRPLTHLITLNQTTNESKENTMRINVAKSRFFKKGDPFKIATDYDHEQFYDRARTLNIRKAG